MQQNMIFSLFLGAIVLCCLNVTKVDADEEIIDTIDTKYGKLKGVVEEGYNGRKALVFRGVPFAQPPLDALRFRDPKAIEKFPSDPFEANKNAKACIQLKPSKSMKEDASKNKDANNMQAELEKLKPSGGFFSFVNAFKTVEDSEDCLYMNIYMPAAKSSEKRAMVMVIHGGMFSFGGVGPEVMSLSVFATFNNVIVAVPQFRMGVFGFAYSNITQEVAGNQGLFDQVEALKFFRSLAEPLNGNLEMVTMWGWQSGGWSVGFHMFSTHSNTLFNQAIMESGSSLSPILLFPEEGAALKFRKFAAHANCGDIKEVINQNKEEGEKQKKEFLYETRPDTMECVYKLTLDQINEAQGKMMASKRESGFMPVEDNRFFTGNPFDSVMKSDFGKVHTLLMGVNSNEGGIALTMMFPDVYPLLRGEPKPMDLNQLLEHSKSNGGDGGNGGQIQLMLPMFFRGVDKNDPVAVRNHLQLLIRDAMVVCLDNMLMDEYLLKPNNQVFYYMFDQRPSNSPFAEWLHGAQHADQLQYVFGYPFKADLASNYKKIESDLSKKVMGMWGSFIKYGSPVAKLKTKWVPCKDKERSYALFTGKSCKPQKGFLKNQCKDISRYYAMARSFLKNYKG